MIPEPIKELLWILWILCGTARNLIIVLAVWTVTFFITKALPKHSRRGFHNRASHMVMLVFCCIAVWIPGLRPGFADGYEPPGTGLDGAEPGFRIALGILLALGAYLVPVIVMAAVEKWMPNQAKRIRKVIQ